MNAEPVIAAVGDNTIDEYTGQQAGSYVGGNALNVAVNCARLGTAAEYFGAVGPDPRGQRVRDTLRRQGVGTGGLTVLDGVTSVSIIRVDETGDRHFEHEDFGVCARYAPGQLDLRRLAGFSAVHIGLLPHPAPLREWLHTHGVLVSQDCAHHRGLRAPRRRVLLGRRAGRGGRAGRAGPPGGARRGPALRGDLRRRRQRRP